LSLARDASCQELKNLEIRNPIMTALVIAEHDNASLKGSTLNTITAAAQAGGDVHVLVAGHNAGGAAEAASKIAEYGRDSSRRVLEWSGLLA